MNIEHDRGNVPDKLLQSPASIAPRAAFERGNIVRTFHAATLAACGDRFANEKGPTLRWGPSLSGLLAFPQSSDLRNAGM